MKNKTLWIGFVVVFIVMQSIGFVVHTMLMADTYANLGSVMRAENEMNDMMWMMMLSGVIMIFMFCYIFTKGYEGTGIMEGVRFGLMVGIMMAGAMAIDPHVIFPLPSDVAVVWLLTGVGTLVLGGAVFAAIYKPDNTG